MSSQSTMVIQERKEAVRVRVDIDLTLMMQRIGNHAGAFSDGGFAATAEAIAGAAVTGVPGAAVLPA